MRQHFGDAVFDESHKQGFITGTPQPSPSKRVMSITLKGRQQLETKYLADAEQYSTTESLPLTYEEKRHKTLAAFLEMGEWYVRHRRLMPIKDIRAIGTKYFGMGDEYTEFLEYLASPEGLKEFRRELRQIMRDHRISIPPEAEWLPLTEIQSESKKYVRVLSPGQTVFYFDDLVLKESFNKENERVRKLGQNPATGEVWEEGKPRRLPQSETISLPEEGIFKVGDVFKTARGEAILDFYAGADRKWVVTYEPEGKQVRLDVATILSMVDSGEWEYQPKEFTFPDLEFLATVKDLSELTQFCKQNPQKLDLVMRVLYLAGVDDRTIDYISGGLWARKKAIIGLTVEGGTFSPDIINLLAATEGDPIRKFCCRQCGECAPKELLEEGKFPERISWLRKHYAEKHPGLWGRGGTMPSTEGKQLATISTKYLADSPEFLTQTIDDSGYLEKLDKAFQKAMARVRK